MATYYDNKISQAISTCKSYTDSRIAEVAPIGSIICVAAAKASNANVNSSKYLLLDGTRIQESSYTDLSRVISNAYGNKDYSSSSSSDYRTLPNMCQEGIFLGGSPKNGISAYKDWQVPEFEGSLAGDRTVGPTGIFFNTGRYTFEYIYGGSRYDYVMGVKLSYSDNYKGHTGSNDIRPNHYQVYYYIRCRT